MQQWCFWHDDEGSKHQYLRRSQLGKIEHLDPRVQRLIDQSAEVHTSMFLVLSLRECEYVVLYCIVLLVYPENNLGAGYIRMCLCMLL